MAKKHDIEFIRTFIEKTGCKLISTEYKSIDKNIKIQCGLCKKIFKQRFSDFKKNKKYCCSDCSVAIFNETRRQKNHIRAKIYIESVGCKLISKDYINARTSLKIKCNSCDNTFDRTLDNFKRFKSYKCSDCSMKDLSIKTSKRLRHSIDWVKDFSKSLGSNCLSDTYDPYVPSTFECVNCKKPFDRLLSVVKLSNTLYCKECGKYQSGIEYQLQEYIKEISKEFKVIFNDRKLIKPYEVDVYIPTKNIAIELDGIYYHSELNGKDNKYHLMKTKMSQDKGIHLIHIFESEWNYKKEIVKSIIKSKLNLNKRIFARKCKVQYISMKEKDDFLNANHIQGSDRSKVRIALLHQNEIVSVMTFGKSRYNKNVEWEMLRFCNKIGYSVVGGASKLFKKFLEEFKPVSIISYSDKRYFDGKIYNRLGFKYSHDSKPNYFYFKGNKKILFSRVQFQKHKLPKLLENFDSTLTEWENMKLNGYNRIWDCGNSVYVFQT